MNYWTPRLAPLLLVVATACRSNAYEDATPATLATFKEISVPFTSGTRFHVSQGAFGAGRSGSGRTHDEKGGEYRWDFDVPLGTDVVAAEDGVVLYTHRGDEGGCDRRFNGAPSSILVRADDGTVAQYAHVDPVVEVGRRVHAGERLGATGKTGFLCTPQLCFCVFRSDRTLYDSPDRATVPIRFRGLPGGLAIHGTDGTSP